MDPILSLIVGFIFGLLFFFYDLRGGKKWYRRWHDISNKNPLDPESTKGFVHQQPFSKKLIPAVVIFAVFSFILYYTGNLNPIEILISGGILLGAVMLAFYLGPLLLNILPNKLKQASKAIEKIDELEANFKEKVTKEKETIIEEAPKSIEPDLKEAKDENPTKNWRDGVQDFLDN